MYYKSTTVIGCSLKTNTLLLQHFSPQLLLSFSLHHCYHKMTAAWWKSRVFPVTLMSKNYRITRGVSTAAAATRFLGCCCSLRGKKRPTSLLKDGKKSCKRKKSLDERSVFQCPQFPGGELSLSINGNEKLSCISGRRVPELARGVIETQDRKWEFYTLVLHYLLREEKCQK